MNTISPDEFVLDPAYLAYQEELRCLIFHTAQTAAPSREGSPGLEPPPDLTFSPEKSQETQDQVKTILSTGRHIEYLRNYVAEVAPWVRIPLPSALPPPFSASEKYPKET